LFDDFLLLKAISELLLSLAELRTMTLDEGCRSQCIFNYFWEFTFQFIQNGMDRLSILDSLADVLIQELERFLKFGLDFIRQYNGIG